MMKFELDKLRRTSLRNYVYDIDADIDVVKYIISCGYDSDFAPSGYAHLLEHMYINTNYDYLKKIESEGANFNATTTKDFIKINIVDPTGKKVIYNGNFIKDNELIYTKFNQKQLDLEKKTIIQEHNILKKTLGNEKTDYMLGNDLQIESFSIDKLNKIHEYLFDKYIRVIFTKPLDNDKTKLMKDIKGESVWLDKLKIQTIVNSKEFFIIHLNDNYNARILFYSLYIFFDETLQLGSPSYNIKVDKLEIKVPLEYVKFIEYVNKYKYNSMMIYMLKFNLSFKFLSNEIANIINLFDLYFDEYALKNESFYFEQWEKTMGDYI